MALDGKQLGRIVIDFFHVLAAGVFPGSVIAAWVIRLGIEAQGLGGAAIGRASTGLWLLFFIGLVVSVGTGALRLRYWKLVVLPEALEAKAQMAAVKHSLFVLLLLSSAVGLYLVQLP